MSPDPSTDREAGSVYDTFDVPTVINCVGEHTHISGTLMREAAAEAMAHAATEYVQLAELQTAASKRIAEITGAERGYVTNGAASALTLATAACIAGRDYGMMNQLPDTRGIDDKVIIPAAHQNEYDVAFRLAGATLVPVGMNDLGNGREDVESWEVAEAISEETVAVAYVDRPHNQLPLGRVVNVAHEADIPVIVDAAAELPPTDNFTRYVDAGADLVAFSGGKAIRGPQTTGILAGRRDLVESIALQHLPSGTHEDVWDPPEYLIRSDRLHGMPRHGIGRPMKVGKEEVVGLLVALDEFLAESDEETLSVWNDRTRRLETALTEIDAIDVELNEPDEPGVPATLCVSMEDGAGSTTELVRRLREGDPRVFIGGGSLDRGYATLNPKCLDDELVDLVIQRIRTAIGEVA